MTAAAPIARPNTPSDRFIASVVASDPKLWITLAVLRAMSPGEEDAWSEVGRRMVRAAD